MFAGKKSAQIREILISESAWEEMTCLFAPSLDEKAGMRVICDYVSGMTDGYATKLYEKILIPRKGSIFDHLWRGKNDAPSSIGL